MGLKDLGLKLKEFRSRLFGNGDIGRRGIPISHGYDVCSLFDETVLDTAVVQREQIQGLEVWFYGVFDPQIGDSVNKYMQSHFFEGFPEQCNIERESKETMRKAYLSARAKARETQKSDEKCIVDSATVMVINGEKLVMANMGNYRVVVCRDGKPHQISTRHWSRRLFSGGNQVKGSELAVGAVRIDSKTEFVILASNGIWEVMNNQEAVCLIHHIEDPQEAAACLANEALNRRSKSCISCIVIRFD